jgi:ferredoxin--NADP+ reductase
LSSLGTAAEPLRVAIVGSGPAGFYAAGHLLSNKAHPDLVAEVDVFDRLPTPWGLVRAGVAPDHPNIKAVSRVYEKTAAKAGFRFFGGVEIGRDVSREQLLGFYNAVIYAYGAETDRHMGIPGEELPGSVAATEFVAWYNGHPDYFDRTFDLTCKHAVVIGNGNVAMDVARMLALTEEELRSTDTADHAIPVLSGSSIEEIVIVGRRGPAQAAFTNPELLELGEMVDADVSVDPADVVLDAASVESIAGEGEGTPRRNVEILRGYSSRVLSGKRRRIVLRFLWSPVRLIGDERVSAIELVRNELVMDGGSLRARATGVTEVLEAGIVFRSIGYRGKPLPGVSFDSGRAVIPNEGGRVIENGERFAGEYVVGWIKRGPSGVIGTNKKDAHETVDALLEDFDAGLIPSRSGSPMTAVLNGYVDYSGWQSIDRAEKAAGESQGRPRVKLCTYEELLAAASS